MLCLCSSAKYFFFCLILVTTCCVLAVFVSRMAFVRDVTLAPKVPCNIKRLFIRRLGPYLVPAFVKSYNQQYGEVQLCAKCIDLATYVSGKLATMNNPPELMERGVNSDEMDDISATDAIELQKRQREWYLLAVVFDRFLLWLYLLFALLFFVIYLTYGIVNLTAPPPQT